MKATPEIKERVAAATRAFQRRDFLRPHWEAIWKYTAPERHVSSVYNASGSYIDTDVYANIYDSTAIDAVQMLIDEMLTGFIPQHDQWFQLVPGPNFPEGSERDQFKRSLAVISKKLWLTISGSNLYSEVAQGLIDYITVGPMVIKAEPADSEGVRYRSYPVDMCAIEEGREGKVEFVYVETMLYGWEIQKNKDWYAQISDDMKTVVNEKPDEPHRFWAMTWPDVGTKFHYVLVDATDKETVIEHKENLDGNPFMVPRFCKVPLNPYGRSLGTIGKADVLALNRLQELFLQGLSLEMLGQYVGVADGVFNPYTFSPAPNQVIAVEAFDNGRPNLQKLESPTDINIARLGINDKRNDVRNMFRANRFGQHGLTPPSATEVNAREELLMKAFGGALPIMVNEFLIPLLQRTLHITMSGSKELKIDRKTVDVLFLAPIPRAQKMQKAQVQTSYVSVIGGMAQVDPTVVAVVDMHKIARSIGENMDIPPDMIRTEDEVKEFIEDGVAGQQQMAAQAEMTQQQQQQGAPLVQ